MHEYTAGQVKQAVVGKGRALKPQVQEMVRRLLQLPGMPSPGRGRRARLRDLPRARQHRRRRAARRRLPAPRGPLRAMTRAPRPQRLPAAVIFDMDGLMLDTERLAPRAWIDAAAALSVEFDLALTQPMVGRNFRDCQAIIVNHYGDDYPTADLMRAWHAAYDAIVEREGIALKPGLLELLDWLDGQRIPKAVATSTRRDRAQAKLASTALLSRFVALVGGDEVARGKPEPDIFLAAAERLGETAQHCLVLEDSEPGVRAALAAGMTPIMVPDLHPPSAALIALEPLILASLAEVPAQLAALPRN